MISSLDSRYAEKLKVFDEILGDKNFVYFMSVWSIAYAKARNLDAKIEYYTDKEELYGRVAVEEKICKHQMVALLNILKMDYPNVVFHYGLTSEDIMHNARWAQVTAVIHEINSKLQLVSKEIANYGEQVPFPILGHTHGQPATPISITPYLRAKADIQMIMHPKMRCGGSNGQTTIFNLLKEDVGRLSATWEINVREILRLQIPSIDYCGICSGPNLLQIGPSNETTITQGMTTALKLRSLCRALWDHCSRGILVTHKDKKQAGSSAMPHKSNPIIFENAEGCFSIAYSILENSLQANLDSRGLRDLSNSVINRNAMDGWCYLYLGVDGLLNGMKTSTYNSEKILTELREHPECLTELLRYYLWSSTGEDKYWALKEKPVSDFDEAVKYMENWDLNWPHHETSDFL